MHEAVEFRGGHLRAKPLRIPNVMLHRVAVGHGVGLFAKFVKGSDVITRLLVGASQFNYTRRPLAHTDIIETLTGLREGKRLELREKQERADATQRLAKMEHKIDLQLDSSKPKPIAPIRDLPQFVEVHWAMEGDPVQPFRLLIHNNERAPLWVELTLGNVDYLHRAVLKQLMGGAIHHSHPRVRRGLNPVGVVGVSRIYKGKKAGGYRFSKGKSTTLVEVSDDDGAKEVAADIFDSIGKRKALRQARAEGSGKRRRRRCAATPNPGDHESNLDQSGEDDDADDDDDAEHGGEASAEEESVDDGR